MTAVVPDWMLGGLTAAEYETLPEDVCRQIEVVDGAILVSSRPRRAYQRIAQRLALALDQASGPELEAVSDVDLRLRDVPLLNRRPDVVVYPRRCRTMLCCAPSTASWWSR